MSNTVSCYCCGESLANKSVLPLNHEADEIVHLSCVAVILRACIDELKAEKSIRGVAIMEQCKEASK